jgi:geranylgeranylglycerol-phosphate geranylgeranyltransferase
MLSRKIRGLIRLIRPDLAVAAGICVIVGQVVAAGRFPPWGIAVLGFLCAFCISGSALILNDYFDIEVDRINAPDRPLPSGAVTRAEVIAWAGVVSLTGLGAAAALGMDTLIVGVVFWWIGFLYNWRFKQSGLPGNLMVSSSVAVTFILGAMTVHAPWRGVVWTFSAIAFLIDLGEEIAADAMDMEGDKARGSQSIALQKGKQTALRVSVGAWSLVIVLSFLPVLMGWLGMVYLIFILVTDGLILYSSIRLLRSQDDRTSRRILRITYLGATLGLVAFVIGQVIR